MVNFKPIVVCELPESHSLLSNILQLQMDNFKISKIGQHLIFVL